MSFTMNATLNPNFLVTQKGDCLNLILHFKKKESSKKKTIIFKKERLDEFDIEM